MEAEGVNEEHYPVLREIFKGGLKEVKTESAAEEEFQELVVDKLLQRLILDYFPDEERDRQ